MYSCSTKAGARRRVAKLHLILHPIHSPPGRPNEEGSPQKEEASEEEGNVEGPVEIVD